MIEYTGLIAKYRVARKLTKREVDKCLHRNRMIQGEETPHLRTPIRLNSTYLEVVDKYFLPKGGMTTIAIVWTAVFGNILAGIMIGAHTGHAPIWIYPVFFALYGTSIVLIWYAAIQEMHFTYYPIRFNRKNRMVYVFRKDGTVMRERWDDLYFTIGSLPTSLYEVQMHRLAEDRCTVIETVGMGICVPRVGLPILSRFWEFHRRFMEEGPAHAAAAVDVFQDVVGRTPNIREGFYLQLAEAESYPILDIIMGFIALIVIPGRWIAIKRSRIPQWPADVEAECAVEADDPWLRDATTTGQKLYR